MEQQYLKIITGDAVDPHLRGGGWKMNDSISLNWCSYNVFVELRLK